VKAWIEARGRGPVDIQQGKSGQFDVVVDGRVAYSKYETGKFPSEAELEAIRF
jgi:predicted Rdx family selenoprotein